MTHPPQTKWVGMTVTCVRCHRTTVLTMSEVPLQGRSQKNRWYTNVWLDGDGSEYARWWACPWCMQDDSRIVWVWAEDLKAEDIIFAGGRPPPAIRR